MGLIIELKLRPTSENDSNLLLKDEEVSHDGDVQGWSKDCYKGSRERDE